MARYTMKLGDIVDSGYDLWNFDYPCIAGYRKTFEEKFELNFYDREINFLTADEFRHHLNARLNLIMPYYVQLQKSQFMIDNPFLNYKMVENTDRTTDDQVFFNSVDTATHTDAQKNVSGRGTVATYQEGVESHEGSTDDATLHRDETASKQSNTNSVENVDEDTTRHLDRDRMNDFTGKVTEEETIDTQRDIDVTDNLQKVVETEETEHSETDRTQDTTYHETTRGTKDTRFSDTPQENFVIGNSGSSGAISTYATTLTNETTSGEKDSTETVTENVGSDTTRNKTENTNSTEKTVTDDHTNTTRNSVANTVNNEHEVTGEDETGTLDRKTDFVSQTNENAVGTVDEKTHDDFVDDQTRTTKAVSNEQVGEQERIEREGSSGAIRKTDRAETEGRKELYVYEGYKQVSVSDLLMKFRQTFLNIDRDIFNELEVLFLGVY